MILLRFVLLSLHQLLTKYQSPYVSQKFLLLSQFQKRRDSLDSSLFKLRQQQKLAGICVLYLVFSQELMQQK